MTSTLSSSYDKTAAPAPTWTPEQEEEKIQYAFRMVQDAFRSKTQSLENEIRTLRMNNDELKQTVSTLQKKHAATERDLIDTHQRCQSQAEEIKNLTMTNRTVMKQLDKHKKLQQTFAEALEMHHTVGGAKMDEDDDTRMDYSAAPIANDYSSRAAAPTSFSVPSSLPQAHVPSPKNTSTAGSANISFDQNGVDGKQFFRAARGRLSYEAFNAFLANIKRLNSHQQTREETLEEAKRIFGSDNPDLYVDFTALLNRHT